MYKDIWNPRIGVGNLKNRHENGSEHDEFTIGAYRNKETKDKIVGHIPLYLSKIMYKRFQLSQSKLGSVVLGNRMTRDAHFGLEIPVKYTLYGQKRLYHGFREK